MAATGQGKDYVGINDTKLMSEESKEDEVRPAAREVQVINLFVQSILLLLLLHEQSKETFNGRRVCTISMYPFRRVSFYIQYTYSFSHKMNLFSLQFKIK